MSEWYFGPETPSSAIQGLLEALVEVHESPLTLSDLQASRGSAQVSVVLSAVAEDDAIEAASWLAQIESQRPLNVVAITTDGYLGTDAADPSDAVMGAAVVSAVRAIAVSRNEVRANVVAVPESFAGHSGSHRGPLAHDTDVSDVAEAVLFLMDHENSYLSGQVLFVDSGRHLFSSHTS